MKPTLMIAPESYERQNEQQFRSQVEEFLDRITAGRERYVTRDLDLITKTRTIDANNATPVEVREVLATLINDLKQRGII